MAQDAQALMQQAEDALNPSGMVKRGLSYLMRDATQYEEAARLFTDAANAYRMKDGFDKEAGRAFERAADIHENKLKDNHEMAMQLVEAFKAYKENDPKEAARVLEKVIKHYSSSGNLRRAATFQENLAELYEVQLMDPEKVFEAYKLAAEWYKKDNAEALANKIFLKMADIAAIDRKYFKAIEQYERVAKSSINNNLMRFSVPKYLFKAGICYLASNNTADTQTALNRYEGLDPSFKQTREYRFFKDLKEAVEENDPGKFAGASAEFERVSHLDNWTVEILLRVKKTMEDTTDDFS